MAGLDVTDSDPDITAVASLPTEQSRDSSQVENIFSSKRYHSTSVGRRTRRKLNENVQEGDRDDEQVNRAPENCIETPEGDRDEEQVHGAPENCIETPEDDRDHDQVQRQPESHM